MKHPELNLGNHSPTSQPFAHTCSQCGKSFQTMELLKVHASTDHAVSGNIPCDSYDHCFESATGTPVPMAGNIPVCTPTIPQYDGIDDSVVDGALTLPVSSNNVDVLTRVANFELNEKRQTSGIYRDANN